MKSEKHQYKIVSVVFGCLGTINSIILGFYLLLTNLALSSLIEPADQFLGHLGSGVAMLCAFLVAYGTYLTWKDQNRKGGITNLGAAIILCSTYAYFTFLANPKILDWLGPAGLLLLVPPILSGSISIVTD